MGKHTPGPWKAKATCDEFNPFEIRTKTEYGDLLFIAQLYDGLGNDEEEANAHLIAAAPDLLAACKAALNRLKEINDIMDIDSFGAMQQIQAAIAKAEGESDD